VIQVFLADDHRLVREGLRRILEASPDMEVVGEAGAFEETLAGVASTRPEVVVLDIALPGPGFLESLRVLHARGLGVVALGSQPESRFGARSLQAGASAYLSKERTPDELLWAIRRVHEGRTYTTAETARDLVRKRGDGGARPAHETLSEREFEVLLHLGAGKTVGEIGRQIGVSPKTVSTYRSRLLEKLGLATTADIVRYALEHDLL
jgi:DNA-binding NarL/FixJ family response regulator